jgi:hypothetical protein
VEPIDTRSHETISMGLNLIIRARSSVNELRNSQELLALHRSAKSECQGSPHALDVTRSNVPRRFPVIFGAGIWKAWSSRGHSYFSL